LNAALSVSLSVLGCTLLRPKREEEASLSSLCERAEAGARAIFSCTEKIPFFLNQKNMSDEAQDKTSSKKMLNPTP